MTTRERAMAVLNYEKYDRLPLVHFGYWKETLQKWKDEGHITQDMLSDGGPDKNKVSKALGFDCGWGDSLIVADFGLRPVFETRIVEERADGTYLEVDPYGVTVQKKRGETSIPAEVSHTLVDRESWEKEYVHRFQFSPGRIPDLAGLKGQIPDDEPRGLYCGSLYGVIRNIAGIVGLSYIYADDEELYAEIIDTVARLAFDCTKAVLEQGVKFDYAHFWEDICFKNGPLVSPSVFEEYVGKHYQQMTDLLKSYGVKIVSLDCDGCIDALIPTWINHGVNTMFPIEVGTWNANIAAWREQYGKALRGVGGMNKNVLAYETAAINTEIERLRPLVELGGYIPCPDHRIPPGAKWENVQYYCDMMRKVFG